ncbi:TIGR02444 family protein [Vibrio sp. SCSIO 43136]|uniref:TIGR02444 family protein n=1 Tax=Vibrio sp. SCSIO 43136 TaxID=2819101 RepID=UPI002074BD14|nr:TIGR02444 family protein [Vibrio sp. SCSIO 43136]USD65518.1 TIGR02444 family protein [Vibrio sp. SCSIO 43136]
MSQEHAPSLTLERLWQFSLQYYGVREIAEACLHLQNHYHGNVNLVLLLKWLDEQALGLDDKHWPTLHTCLARTETLLLSYRELRKKFKTQLPDTTYREALQFELQLEKQQQSDLVDCINHLPLKPNATPSLTRLYCKQLGADHLIDVFSRPAQI